jgi:hypothetical protein
MEKPAPRVTLGAGREERRGGVEMRKKPGSCDPDPVVSRQLLLPGATIILAGRRPVGDCRSDRAEVGFEWGLWAGRAPMLIKVRSRHGMADEWRGGRPRDASDYPALRAP